MRNLLLAISFLAIGVVTNAANDTRLIGKVGEFSVFQSTDPWTDETQLFAVVEYDGGFMKGAKLIVLCKGDTPMLAVQTDFIVAAPELTPKVKIKYRVGKSYPREAEWRVLGKGDTLAPYTGQGIVLLGELVRKKANRFLIGVEDGLGEYQTLDFFIDGIEELGKLMPCMSPDGF